MIKNKNKMGDMLRFKDINEAAVHYAQRLLTSDSIKSTNAKNTNRYKNELGGEVYQQFFVIDNPQAVIGTYESHKPFKWWMYGEFLSEMLNLDPPIMYKYRPELFDQHYDLLPDGRMQYHYGNRWVEFNQITNVHEKLKKNINSKRGVISIYAPYDNAPNRADAPCTLGYSLLHRDGKLNMTTMLRSWDFFGGFKTYDVALASFVQQSFCNWLNVKPGDLGFYVTSLHYYNRDKTKLEHLVEEANKTRQASELLVVDGNLDISTFYNQLRDVKLAEEAACNGNYQRAELIKHSLTSCLFRDMCDTFITKVKKIQK